MEIRVKKWFTVDQQANVHISADNTRVLPKLERVRLVEEATDVDMLTERWNLYQHGGSVLPVHRSEEDFERAGATLEWEELFNTERKSSEVMPYEPRQLDGRLRTDRQILRLFGVLPRHREGKRERDLAEAVGLADVGVLQQEPGGSVEELLGSLSLGLTEAGLDALAKPRHWQKAVTEAHGLVSYNIWA